MYKKKNQTAYQAHRAVISAIQLGTLVRPKRCEQCKKRAKTEAHHEDYTKPLEVTWLCRKCHGSRLKGRKFKKRWIVPKAKTYNRLFKTSQVANICGVSSRTVAQWLREGSLRGVKLNGFTWRVKEADLDEFIEGRRETP